MDSGAMDHINDGRDVAVFQIRFAVDAYGGSRPAMEDSVEA
jgi:hypothetical protein